MGAGEGDIGVSIEPHPAAVAVGALGVVLATVTHTPTGPPRGEVEVRVQMTHRGVVVAVACWTE